MQRFSLSFLLIAPLAATGLRAAETTPPVTGSMTVLGDTKVSAGTIRATKVLDTEVFDQAGKDIGKVKDILFDRDRDHVSYILIGHGGVAGVGETLWTVPYRALTFGGPTNAVVYAQIPAGVITASPAFDEAKWSGDPDYYRSLDAYYRPHLPAARPSQGQAKADLANGGEAQLASGGLGGSPVPWTKRVSKIIGRDVVSPSGEQLGDINDVVLNASTGDIEYVAMTKSKLLGLDERFLAVPAGALRPRGDDEKFILNMDAAALKTMPSFDHDHWPTAPDPAWSQHLTGSGQATH